MDPLPSSRGHDYAGIVGFAHLILELEFEYLETISILEGISKYCLQELFLNQFVFLKLLKFPAQVFDYFYCSFLLLSNSAFWL